MNGGRVPPHDRKAEAAILGGVLLNNRVLSAVGSIVKADDFYVQAHRVLWEGMLRLQEAGAPIDAVTLGNDLIARGDLERIGGASAMGDLTDDVPTVSSAPHYAGIVARLAALRRVLYVTQGIAEDVFKCGGGDPSEADECLAKARNDIIDATALSLAGGGPQPDSKDLAAVLDQLEKGGEPPGLVRTGLHNIDKNLGGLWPGLLTVCAARPSMGKSAFALAIAGNVAKNGGNVLFITLEDTRHFVVLRRLSRYSGIDLTDLTLRRVHKDDWRQLIDAAEIIHRAPVQVDDTAGLSAAAISQVATSQKVTKGLDLLIVDHLGEVAGDGRDSMFEVVTKAGRGLRDLAKTLHIPVLLMAQLNRKVEERTDKRPQLSDLRQSGEIEQMARNVWFLFRRGYYLPDAADDHDLQLIVAKQAHGKTGMLELWTDLAHMDVRDWEIDRDGEFPLYRPRGSGLSSQAGPSSPRPAAKEYGVRDPEPQDRGDAQCRFFDDKEW